MLNRLPSLIDHFLPPELARFGQWERLLRGRALVGVLLLSLLHTAGMVPPMLTLAPEGRIFVLVIGGAGVATAVLVGALLWALRRGWPSALLANIFLGYSALTLAGVALATGGFPSSPLLLFLVAHPVMALLTAGRRSALVWLALVVAWLLLVPYVDAEALVPQAPPAVIRKLTISTWVVITLALFAMVYCYDVITRSLATSISRERDQADFAAAHDPLTGLLNRGAFQPRLAALLARCRREQRPCALLMIDLDGFKPVNDRHGHHVGDSLLQHLAARMRSTVREQDLVARIGGDEFAGALEGMARGEALERAVTQLLAALSRRADVEGVEVAVSASIGVALFPADGEEIEALLRSADRAMYGAKRRGRNCVVYAAELHAS